MENLEIIKINEFEVEFDENGEPFVWGRKLHSTLKVLTAYKDWFPRMCEYGFTEKIDFCSILSESTGGRPSVDHKLKLDMAKEIAMLQRSETGKAVRKYLIQVEKDFNTPEKVMARALKYASMQLSTVRLENKQLQLENDRQNQLIGELKPKADYTDKILQSKGTVMVNVIANDYGLTAQALNKKLHELGIQYKQGKDWLLYRKYRGLGYTHSKTIHFFRKDGTPDTSMNMEWTQKGRLFLYELLKKNGIVPEIEKVH